MGVRQYQLLNEIITNILVFYFNVKIFYMINYKSTKLLIFISILCFQSMKAQDVNKFKLEDDIIVFPIKIIDAFPMIGGEANGLKGYFFFDTGLNTAIEINHNFVPLDKDKSKEIGNAFTGSGQNFEIRLNDNINEVKLINGLTFKNLNNIQSGNFQHIQNVTTVDCLGYIGYEFFEGYIAKMDYVRRRLTFYKNSEERQKSKDFLQNENIIAVLDFKLLKLKNIPVLMGKIGDIELQIAMDTGQYGMLQIVEEDKSKLIQQNILKALSPSLFNINEIILDNKYSTKLKGIYLITDESKAYAKKPIQISTVNFLSLGHRLLDEYNTVWDYENKKLYLLER